MNKNILSKKNLLNLQNRKIRKRKRRISLNKNNRFYHKKFKHNKRKQLSNRFNSLNLFKSRRKSLRRKSLKKIHRKKR